MVTTPQTMAAAYLARDPGILPWFNEGGWHTDDLAAWWQSHADGGWPRDRLADIHPLLADEDCSCVVTGQQPAYGGGPLYTLLKTAHALALTHQLRARGMKAVCIFWCASEDHDAGEADHADLVAHDGRVHRLRIAMRQTGASTRHQPAAIGWPELVEQCATLFPTGLGAGWLQAQAPGPGEGLGAWLCRLITAFFDDDALACIEAHQLRGLWSGLRSEIEQRWPRTALAARRQEILAAGFDDALGALDRPPLFRDDAGARTALAAGEDCPADQLSSGAALRPIIQQRCLPCCAYVGGPGEIAYHAQLKPAYAALGAHMPVLVPRLGGALLSSRLARGFAAWGIDPHTLRGDSVAPPVPTTVDLEPLAQAIDALRSDDEQAARRLATGRRRLQRELDHLRGSLQRGERQRLQRPAFALLRDQLFPRGSKQERVMSSVQAIWEHGPGLARLLVEAADAERPEMNMFIRLS